jgi:putative hydrolase of the HAD superfamily
VGPIKWFKHRPRSARVASLHADARDAKRVWLLDLDDTLHDASSKVFGELHTAMTGYVSGFVGLSFDDADALRQRYWKRYGATLLGMVKHHRVDTAHFLRETHSLPGLEQHLHSRRVDRAALRHLRGQRIVLTNAPQAYALRVMKALGLHRLVDGVVSIEAMRMMGEWRPKPDGRMLQRLVARLKSRPEHCWLVDDTLGHLKAAHRLGMKTAWAQGHARPKSRPHEVGVYHPAKARRVCAKIRSIQQLRRLQSWQRRPLQITAKPSRAAT